MSDKTLGEVFRQLVQPFMDDDSWMSESRCEEQATKFRDEVLQRERVRVTADGKTPGQMLLELANPGSDLTRLRLNRPNCERVEEVAATLLDAFGDSALRERLETERAAARETIDELREQLAAERAAATDRLDAELAIASATTEELTKLRTEHSRSGLQTSETFAWGTVVSATMVHQHVDEINL